jgi:hypothetical protein
MSDNELRNVTPRHPGTNGRIGNCEFSDLTQREIERMQEECDGHDCFFFPGCRPGECPRDSSAFTEPGQ